MVYVHGVYSLTRKKALTEIQTDELPPPKHALHRLRTPRRKLPVFFEKRYEDCPTVPDSQLHVSRVFQYVELSHLDHAY